MPDNFPELEAFFDNLDGSVIPEEVPEAAANPEPPPKPARKVPLKKEAWAEDFDATQLRDRVVVQLLFSEKVKWTK